MARKSVSSSASSSANRKSVRGSRPKGPVRRLLWRWGWRVVAVILALPPIVVLIYGVVPPPITPLMLIRLVEGEGLTKTWVSMDQIAVALPNSVIAAEDNHFCSHSGFDFDALQDAAEGWVDGTSHRGGSTLSQQTAKNILLWPGGSFFRKGIEAYVTVWMEQLWTKRRILEVYLNVAEWGPGIYGAEAAAQAYFGRSAARLTSRQAALMASVLPNPRRWSPAHPTIYIQRRASILQRRVGQLGPLLACVKHQP